MLSKTILLLFGAVVLLQSSNARYQDMDSAVRAVGERLKLLRYIKSEFASVSEEVMEKGMPVVEKVLEDPQLLSMESEIGKSILKELRDLLKQYEEYKKGTKNSEMIRLISNGFFHIMHSYDDEKKTPETAEEKAIVASLKENGMDEIKEYVNERAKNLTKNFYNQVQKYYEGLNETQKKDEKEILEVMEKYNAEPDIFKRGNILFKFLENAEVENFLW